MELLLTIFLTALVLGALVWVLSRSRLSSYRPSRPQVVRLLQQVIAGEASQQAWDLFIGYPVLHDPELEKIRRRCVMLTEGNDEHPPYPAGLGSYLFNRAGRQQVEDILQELQQLIADEPFQRDF